MSSQARNRYFGGAVACALIVSATAADADGTQPIYVGVKAGASFMEIDDLSNTTNIANPAAVNVTSEDDIVFAVGASIGYNWGKKFQIPLRTDLEYMYRTALNYAPNPTFTNAATPTRSDGDLNSHTVLANLNWDVGTWNGFTPFVGGGLGVAVNNTDTTGTVIATRVSKDYDQTEVNLAWSVGGGVGYAITSNWNVELSYRYIDLGDTAFGDSNPNDAEISADDVDTHEVLVGLRYQF